jgi:hypothetical protein
VALEKPSERERTQWSNDKKRARLAALRHVLSHIYYTGKNPQAVGIPDPRLVGSAADVLEKDATIPAASS